MKIPLSKESQAASSAFSNGSGTSPHDSHSSNFSALKARDYDPVLAPFLLATDAHSEERALEELVRSIEGNVRAILHRKASVLPSDAELGADLYAATILRVLERVSLFKTQLTQGNESHFEANRAEEIEEAMEDAEIAFPEAQTRGKTTISNFKAFAETVARNVVHEHIRLKYPKRTSLQNQLLYVIRHAKNVDGQPHFGLWRHNWERLCGLSLWLDQACVHTERHRLLRDEPNSLAHLALPGHDAATLKLPHLMELLFGWLASPAEFDDVVNAIARLRGVRDVAALSLSDFESDSNGTEAPRYDPPAPGLTPEQLTVLRASLRPLWEQIAGLSRTRSASLLLNQTDEQGHPVIELLIELGVASLSEIARAIELTPRQLAELLPELPLKDKHISELLDCAPASVAVYRMQARKKLQEREAEG